jgi:hypothetical protein
VLGQARHHGGSGRATGATPRRAILGKPEPNRTLGYQVSGIGPPRPFGRIVIEANSTVN